MDALVLVPGAYKSTKIEHDAVAVSLRDGKRLWSETLALGFSQLGKIRVGDVDGDGRQEVVVLDDSSDSLPRTPRVRVLDGRDGKARWTWTLKGGRFLVHHPHDLALARLDGDAKQSVCVCLSDLDEARDVIILDPSGKQRAHREMGGTIVQRSGPQLKDVLARVRSRLDPGCKENGRTTAADLNGDGRDELLLYQGDKLQVWDRDLKDVWFWPTRFRKLEHVIPAARGRPGTVIVPPGVFLDGATGHPRWTGQAPLVDSIGNLMPQMLDAGDSERAPLLITSGTGATVCRSAIATGPDGSVVAPQGKKVVRGSYRNDDPRWARPLPWTFLVGAVGLSGILASGCLVARECVRADWHFAAGDTVAAVVQYVGAHGFAGGRRGAAGRLSGGLAVDEHRRGLVSFDRDASVSHWNAGGDSGGVFLGGAGGESGAAAVEVGAGFSWGLDFGHAGGCGGWVWVDRRSMAVGMEHYAWEGWEWVLLVGGYVAAVIWGMGRVVAGVYGRVRRTGVVRGERERE